MVKFKPLNIKPIKDKGTYVFGDFSIGLYYLDTPRLLGEQLASLALVGGQNVWAEKGALVPQYGYKVLDKLPEGERPIIVTNDTASSASFFIVSVDGEGQSHVYLYTANQGLKKYKTDLGSITDAVAAHDGKNLIINYGGGTYLFGSYYSSHSTSTLLNESIPIRDYGDYYQFTIPTEDIDYYWNGKELMVEIDNTEFHMTVIRITPNDTNILVDMVLDGAHQTFTDNVADISEATIIEADLIYYPEAYTAATPVYEVSGSTPYTAGWLTETEGSSTPLTPAEGINYLVVDDDSSYYNQIFIWDGTSYVENENIETTTIYPALIEVAQNRLFVVDEVGRIYYSCIGGVDILAGGEHAFEEAADAGYFEGFYRDSSKVLSIEDYMDGILICKENGIYYLTLQTPQYQIQETGGGSGVISVSQMQVGIKKISNIGQQYAGDHVIVRESVIAYDSNSGTLVNAASVNVFNTIVAGDVIIDSAALNAYNSGITATKRKLVYNGQESVFILYYGEDLSNGVVLRLNATLFPRKLDIPMEHFIGFNQGVTGVGTNGEIVQDFKNGTIIEGVSAYADFEAIGVRDNRHVVSTILEVTELNGTNFTVTTKNTGTSVQSIQPNLNIGVRGANLPPLLYSDREYDIISDSYELTSRWADKKASVTRVAAPMSGRDGVSISIEFPKNTSFCLAALRLPDFSLGEI